MKKKYDEMKNQLVEDITKLEDELKNIERFGKWLLRMVQS